MEDRVTQELELSTILTRLKRRIWWILALGLIVALAVFLLSKKQGTVFEATSSIISANRQVQDSIVNGALIQAPPLPEGAVTQALQSTVVIEPLIISIRKSIIFSDEQKTIIIRNLSNELRQQRLKTVTLISRLDVGGSGIYTLTAKASSARSAQELANLATSALLSWDEGRALQNVRKAKGGFQAQLQSIDRQLSSNELNSVERQTLITRRVTTQDNLAQVSVLETSAVGVLNLLSAAVEPLNPIAPNPGKNAILAGLLTVLVGIGIFVLKIVLDKTVRLEEDLLSLNLATLGIIPRLRRRDIVFNGIVRAAREAGLYESIGFLRVNLLNALENKAHPVLMVSSTMPGEGKSSLTAALADGFAASGQRVLIVDADLRRGTQAEVWQKFSRAHQWIQLTGTGGVRTSQEAFINPENVQVMRTEENLDVLPAGDSLHDSLSLLNKADIMSALELWRNQYDIILIDSAPLLALADGLVVGKHVDGVLMVTEYGKTSLQSVRSAVRRSERAGLKVLGFVINKADRERETSYSYEYAPRSVPTKV